LKGTINIKNNINEIIFDQNLFDMLYISIKKPNGISIIGYSNLNVENIIIPDLVDNLKVVEIGPLALSHINKCKSIHIGKNVKVIGDDAFINSETIDHINLGIGVEVLGSTLFEGCKGLKTIIIGPSVKEIDEFCFHKDLQSEDQINVSIFVDDKNPFYYQKKGNIFRKKDNKQIYKRSGVVVHYL
jgi:hypothetical protein